MFKVDDYVSYGKQGIFQIRDITKRKADRKIQNYYILYANHHGLETSISTPVSNPSLRLLSTKEDIAALVKKMPELDTIWYEDKKVRDDKFQDLLTSNDISCWAQLAKSIYVINERKMADRKHISDKDKLIFTTAEDLLYEEIATACHIQRNLVEKWIESILLH